MPNRQEDDGKRTEQNDTENLPRWGVEPGVFQQIRNGTHQTRRYHRTGKLGKRLAPALDPQLGSQRYISNILIESRRSSHRLAAEQELSSLGPLLTRTISIGVLGMCHLAGLAGLL